MRKIFLNNKGSEIIQEISDLDDLPEFNKNLLNQEYININAFEVFSKGYNVKVDLKNGIIIIDGQEVELEVDEATKIKLTTETLKWVNFRRVRESFRMQGLKSRSTKYGVGFHGNIDGKNFKRFVLLDRNSRKLIKE